PVRPVLRVRGWRPWRGHGNGSQGESGHRNLRAAGPEFHHKHLSYRTPDDITIRSKIRAVPLTAADWSRHTAPLRTGEHMAHETLAQTIDDAFEKRDGISPATTGPVRDAVEQ